MARYFVVLPGTSRSSPYIVAEVAREVDDGETSRESSLAANLAGEEAEILTRQELVKIEGGREALQRWNTGDDIAFEDESVALEGDTDPSRDGSGEDGGRQRSAPGAVKRGLRSVS